MSLLFETIQINAGKPQKIALHNERLNNSRKTLFGLTDFIDLENIIIIPEHLRKGICKCKVTYSEHIKKIEFSTYTPRIISSLQLVECNDIDYTHKYADRTMLAYLKNKSQADEIIIVKNGFITDTSFSNIIFFDGKNWETPTTPLLKGVMRNYLLKRKIIQEKTIRVADVKKYRFCKLINAMLNIDNAPHIENIPTFIF